MKTYEELVDHIAKSIIADRKRGILDSLRHVDFGILCWIYDVTPHELYETIWQKAFVEDLK